MVKKILAIDGGGMYGVVPIEVCIQIEEKMKKPLREIFDLFVGTSTGALISAGALSGLHRDGTTTTFGLSAREIMKAYEDFGKTIFSAKRNNISIPGIDIDLYPKYELSALRTILNNMIGERKMGRLSDRDQHISLSAYNMTKREPYFFRSWVDTEIILRDAVMASASAPTYHSMPKIGSSFYTDGGVFAVNPAVYALADALDIWPDESFVVVSLGTGQAPALEPPDEADEDTFWWLRNLTNIFTDGQNESADKKMVQISKKAPWLKYFRFDVDLGFNKKADELDGNVLDRARDLMRRKLNEQATDFNTMLEVLQAATANSKRQMSTKS